MLFTSAKTLAEFDRDFDRYGDCYYVDSSVDDLKKIFDRISTEVYFNICFCFFFLNSFSLLKNLLYQIS